MGADLAPHFFQNRTKAVVFAVPLDKRREVHNTLMVASVVAADHAAFVVMLRRLLQSDVRHVPPFQWAHPFPVTDL